MANKYILSILIPTRNRGEILKKSLEDLLPKISGKSIEVVISDNNSTDNTKNIVKDLIHKNESIHITLSINEKNLGYDKNAFKCYQLSQGKYCMVLGDKRIMTQNMIDEMMCMLSNPAKDISGIIIDPDHSTDKNEYHDMDAIISKMGYKLSLSSSVLFRNIQLDEIILEKYYDINFMHIGLMFETLKREQQINVSRIEGIFDSCVKQTVIYWKSIFFKTFSEDWFKTILSLPEEISINAKLEALKGPQNGHIYSFRNIIRVKAQGQSLNYKDLKPYLKYMPFCSTQSNVSIIAAVLFPRSILYVVRKIYKILS